MSNNNQPDATGLAPRTPAKPQRKPPALDFSFSRAAIFLPCNAQIVRLTLVGCGGTGSWLAPQIARLARVLREQGRQTELFFIDPDRVSAANVPRSCFCDAEIGQLKAHALARRYGAAWGLDIGVIADRFEPKMLSLSPGADTLDVVIGCVDNAAARRALAEVLTARTPHTYSYGNSRPTLLLDCGNTSEGGQVLLTRAKVREAALNSAPRKVTRQVNGVSQTYILAQPLLRQIPYLSGATINAFNRRLSGLPRQEQNRVRAAVAQGNAPFYARLRDGLSAELRKSSASRLRYFKWAFYGANKPEHPFHLLTPEDQATTWALLHELSQTLAQPSAQPVTQTASNTQEARPLPARATTSVTRALVRVRTTG